MSLLNKLKQINFKESVNLGSMIGLVVWMIISMNLLGIIQLWNWANHGFCIIATMVAFMIPIILTYSDTTLQTILVNLFRFIFNASMDIKTKEEFLKYEMGKLITINTQKKLTLRAQVPTAIFLLYIAGWIILLYICNLLTVTLTLIEAIVALAGLLVFGIEKPSIFTTASNIVKVIFDPAMTIESKLEFIRKQIENLVGIGLALEMEKQLQIEKK